MYSEAQQNPPVMMKHRSKFTIGIAISMFTYNNYYIDREGIQMLINIILENYIVIWNANI